jgi:hypothetical protein
VALKAEMSLITNVVPLGLHATHEAFAASEIRMYSWRRKLLSGRRCWLPDLAGPDDAIP